MCCTCAVGDSIVALGGFDQPRSTSKKDPVICDQVLTVCSLVLSAPTVGATKEKYMDGGLNVKLIPQVLSM